MSGPPTSDAASAGQPGLHTVRDRGTWAYTRYRTRGNSIVNVWTCQ